MSIVRTRAADITVLFILLLHQSSTFFFSVTIERGRHNGTGHIHGALHRHAPGDVPPRPLGHPRPLGGPGGGLGDGGAAGHARGASEGPPCGPDLAGATTP